MSDEAHSHLSGFVKKQNFHCWSATNPIEIHERPLHSFEATVWFGIIGLCFCEDEWERAVTVPGPRYVHMLENFLAPALNHLPDNDETYSSKIRLHATPHKRLWQL
jgi:hypothetical protein